MSNHSRTFDRQRDNHTMLGVLLERAFEVTIGVIFRADKLDTKDMPIAIEQNVPLSIEAIVKQTTNGLNLHAIVGHPGHTMFRVALPVQVTCLVAADPRFTDMASFLAYMQYNCPPGFDYIGYEQTGSKKELLYVLRCPHEINQPITYHGARQAK